MTASLPNAFISDSGAPVPSPDEAAACSPPVSPVHAAADISSLLEIADTRFVLNVREFVEALDPPPLFLRRAG